MKYRYCHCQTHKRVAAAVNRLGENLGITVDDTLYAIELGGAPVSLHVFLLASQGAGQLHLFIKGVDQLSLLFLLQHRLVRAVRAGYQLPPLVRLRPHADQVTVSRDGV